MVSSVLAQAILNQQVPDIVGSFQRGQETGRNNAIRTLAGQAASGDEDAFAELTRLDPETALQLGAHLQAGNAKDLENTLRDARIGQKFLEGGNLEGFLNFANQREQQLRQAGRNPADTIRVRDLAMQDPQAAYEELTQLTGAMDQGGGAQQLTPRQQEFAQLQELQSQVDALPDGPEKLAAQRQVDQFALGTGFSSKRDTADEIREKAMARVRGTESEGRQQEFIDRGLVAADSTANVRRALELIKRVDTGGVAAANLGAKRFFGVEGADEGELSNRLGVAVLSQLKDTFGAAFTAQEGERLEKLSAGFGKSAAANKRILEQALKLSERAANRGSKAARARGDEDSAIEIEDALKFTINDESPAQGVSPSSEIAQQQPRAVLRFDANGEFVQ